MKHTSNDVCFFLYLLQLLLVINFKILNQNMHLLEILGEEGGDFIFIKKKLINHTFIFFINLALYTSYE
jgi:hypothetical protein